MRILLTLAIAFLVSAPAYASEDAVLQTRVQTLANAYQGKVALYAIDLHSGKTVAIDPNVEVPTASVIKLAVLFEALKQIQEGHARFNEPLQLTSDNQVEGSGVLGLFDAPQTLTLKDALTMMVVVSDNTATNLAIDRLGLASIDRRIAWMGLHNTWLYKKVFKPATGDVPADQKIFGLGKTTAAEMAALMERFANCDLSAPGTSASPAPADKKICDTALSMLKNQTDRDAIPRYLDVPTANKTGALDEVRNDVAIVYAKNGPVVISAFTYQNHDQSWTPDNSGQLLMAKMAKTIVDEWH